MIDLTGLTSQDVKTRLARHGFNELTMSRRRSLLAIMGGVLKEPMFLLLLACASLYLILGDLMEAVGLIIAVMAIMLITLYQEYKTERTLEALRDLSSPRALVLRDSRWLRIPGREVVPDDIVRLNEGDRVPADGFLLLAESLLVDESLLSGESLPVRKEASVESSVGITPTMDIGPKADHAYSGTMVIQGQGQMKVLFTGADTAIGSIGKSLSGRSQVQSRLHEETQRVIKSAAWSSLALSAALGFFYVFRSRDAVGGILTGLTLAMAIIPEEIPVVLSVFLAIGAWRIAKKRVLTRQAIAIEALGETTVLCVDKTGTLTQNKMAIAAIFTSEGGLVHATGDNWPEGCAEVIRIGSLASQSQPVDPMELALLAAFSQGETAQRETKTRRPENRSTELCKIYPLTKEVLCMSHIWRIQEGEFQVAAKGAPEVVATLAQLSSSEIAQLSNAVEEMAAVGWRVIAVASSVIEKIPQGDDQKDLGLRFVGLLGFFDPPREEVPEAIRLCRDAGIRVVMITGDYPKTAESIAAQIGLTSRGPALSGAALAKMDNQSMSAALTHTNILSRMIPEQKLRVVEAFKRAGEVVAMTGDGVNDAPALKAAHIGVAMGRRGTDVAREASSLVLLDDDFASIVEAIKMGRRIFDNIQKAISYIIAVHIPIVGISILPVLMGMKPVLLPLHIVFLELVIDPACSVAFEAEDAEKNIMNRPPRPLDERLFSRGVVLRSITEGVIAFLGVLGVYLWGMIAGFSEEVGRSCVFTMLVFSNLILIMVNRSGSSGMIDSLRVKNVAVRWVIAGSLIFLIMIFSWEFTRELFRFGVLPWVALVACVIGALIIFLACEFVQIRTRFIAQKIKG
jgi:Ca2+-transporting ATPase